MDQHVDFCGCWRCGFRKAVMNTNQSYLPKKCKHGLPTDNCIACAMDKFNELRENLEKEMEGMTGYSLDPLWKSTEMKITITPLKQGKHGKKKKPVNKPVEQMTEDEFERAMK